MAVHTAGTPPQSPLLNNTATISFPVADTSHQTPPEVQTQDSAKPQSSPEENARAGRAERRQFLGKLSSLHPIKKLKNVFRSAPAENPAGSEPAPERSGGRKLGDVRQVMRRALASRPVGRLRGLFKSTPAPVATTPTFHRPEKNPLTRALLTDPAFAPLPADFNLKKETKAVLANLKRPLVTRNVGQVERITRTGLILLRDESDASKPGDSPALPQIGHIPDNVRIRLQEFANNYMRLEKELLPQPFKHLRLLHPGTYLTPDSVRAFIRLAYGTLPNAIESTNKLSERMRGLRGSQAKEEAIREIDAGEVSTILPTEGVMEFYFAQKLEWKDVPESAILIHGDVAEIGPGNHAVTMYFQNLPVNGSEHSLFNEGAGIAGHAGASVSVCVKEGNKGKQAHATAGNIRALVISDHKPTDALVIECKDKDIGASFAQYMKMWAVPERPTIALHDAVAASNPNTEEFDNYFSKQLVAALEKLGLTDTPENRETARNDVKQETFQTAVELAKQWQTSRNEERGQTMMSARSTPEEIRSGSGSQPPEALMRMMSETITSEDLKAFIAFYNYLIPYAVPKMSRMYATKALPFEEALPLLQKAYAQRGPNETNWHVDESDGKPKNGTVCTSIVLLCLQMAYIDKGISKGTIKTGVNEENELDFDQADLREITDAIPEELCVHPDTLSPRLFHHRIMKCADFKTIGALRKTPVLKGEEEAVS